MEKCSREKLVDKIVKEYNLTEEDAHNKAVKYWKDVPRSCGRMYRNGRKIAH